MNFGSRLTARADPRRTCGPALLRRELEVFGGEGETPAIKRDRAAPLLGRGARPNGRRRLCQGDAAGREGTGKGRGQDPTLLNQARIRARSSGSI